MANTPAQIEAMFLALMPLLRGDSALSALAPGGVHLVREPRDVDINLPHITVRQRPGGQTYPTMGDARPLQVVNVEILGCVPGAAGGIVALRIEERIDALLSDQELELASPWASGGTMRRFTALDLGTTSDGVEIDRRGGLYRVWLSRE